MFIWKMIDQLALYDLHKKKSKDFQFTQNPLKMKMEERLEDFYQLHATDISFNLNKSAKENYDIGHFKYKSALQSDFLQNDIAAGEVYFHKNEDAPNLIFVHGWRMDSNDRVKKIFHDQVKKLGWNMYYFTLPYHFEREPKQSSYSGEYMISANIKRTIHAAQ